MWMWTSQDRTGSQYGCITFMQAFQTTEYSLLGPLLHLWDSYCCLHFCLTGARRAPKFAVKNEKSVFSQRGVGGGCLWGRMEGWGSHLHLNRLVGLVVRHPPRVRKIPGSNPACAGIFSGSSHTRDSKIGTPLATLPGAWRYRVCAGTGQPGVSILWLGEIDSLIFNFYLSVAAHKLSVQICPWDTLACCWDVKQATSNNNLHLTSASSTPWPSPGFPYFEIQKFHPWIRL